MKYKLETEYIELCNILKIKQLVQTGGHAKIVISEGEVMVDGEVETRKRMKVRKGMKVEFDGQLIEVV